LRGADLCADCCQPGDAARQSDRDDRGGAPAPRPMGAERQMSAPSRAQVEFLKALVRVPSDNPPGDCAAHAEAAAARLEQLGFAVERHPVPPAQVEAHGMVSVVNLVVRERFGRGGPTIALNAHGDVVPPGQGWSRDPYGGEEVDGALYGRGVAVSK